MSRAPSLPGLLPPLAPADYLRLCRLRAGLTIAQAARPHWHRPEHRLEVEDIWRRSEVPGATITADYELEAMAQRGFHTFDPAVYRQLRDDAPEHHPTVCHGCGCTSWQACICNDGSDCVIGDARTCTACEERARRTDRRAA